MRFPPVSLLWREVGCWGWIVITGFYDPPTSVGIIYNYTTPSLCQREGVVYYVSCLRSDYYVDNLTRDDYHLLGGLAVEVLLRVVVGEHGLLYFYVRYA